MINNMNTFYKIILRILFIPVLFICIGIFAVVTAYWGPIGLVLAGLCWILTGNAYWQYTEWAPCLALGLIGMWLCYLEDNDIIKF